jgi:hypothetical protein
MPKSRKNTPLSGRCGRRSRLRYDLHRPPVRYDVCAFQFLTLLAAGCPRGIGFLMNGLNVDPRRYYPVASTRHPSVNNATERELEYDIAKSEAQLRLFHYVYTPQTGLG